MTKAAIEWTPRAIERVRALAEKGYSATQIAARLTGEGFGRPSRSAVIGKMRRLGIPLRGDTQNNLEAVRRMQIRRERYAAFASELNADAARRCRSGAVRKPADSALPRWSMAEAYAGGPVVSAAAAFDHAEGGCAWIHGDPCTGARPLARQGGD